MEVFLRNPCQEDLQVKPCLFRDSDNQLAIFHEKVNCGSLRNPNILGK